LEGNEEVLGSIISRLGGRRPKRAGTPHSGLKERKVEKGKERIGKGKETDA